MRETRGARQVELTERQRQVMRLMAEGKTNWEIASALGIGLEGAKYHVSEILARFDVASREDAVAAWRRQQSPAGRVGRWLRGLAGWSPAKVALGVGGAAVVVAGGVLIALSLGSESEPAANQGDESPPETPEQLLSQMEDALSEDGKILRVRLETTTFNDGVDGDVDVEALFDFREGRALITERTKWDNSPDTYEDRELLAEGVLFRDQWDSDIDRFDDRNEIHPPCIDVGSYLMAVLACGVREQPANFEGEVMPGVQRSTWGGTETYTLTYEWALYINPDLPPGIPPTPTEGPGTPTQPPRVPYTATTRYTFHVDAKTMLPLGLEVMGTRSDTGPAGSITLPFESDLLDRGDVDTSQLDPDGFGYKTPEQIEVGKLDSGGIVFWLGREFDRRPAWPVMRLTRVEGGRDFPPRFQLVSMDYTSDANDQLNVSMWEEDGWDEFFGMLQDAGRQPGYSFAFDEGCLVRTVHEVNGHRVTVLGGVSTGGGAGMISTPTPTVGGACPEPDEFMAVVEVADGRVAVINAPIGIFGRGDAYEAFDSEEGMLVVAGGLVERQKGE